MLAVWVVFSVFLSNRLSNLLIWSPLFLRNLWTVHSRLYSYRFWWGALEEHWSKKFEEFLSEVGREDKHEKIVYSKRQIKKMRWKLRIARYVRTNSPCMPYLNFWKIEIFKNCKFHFWKIPNFVNCYHKFCKFETIWPIKPSAGLKNIYKSACPP